MEDRKLKSKVDVSVATVLLAGRTGPIILELWRGAADNVIRSL